ncbi:hypothetical protein TL16_g06314 [Triparma laevis f. inornata]|uniref:Kinesin motor domain-containing protein n=1 Tax=Triparma laevis f. inornata TaxID=1714386 RepID=A0A9W7AJ92_9STRA|nr:hypothetical protein TL16_g06314 [Triparma laevis f. inornata]
MTTVEEKDLELVALQATFDEYVESSKELETELESELEKLESQLTEALSSNDDLQESTKKLKTSLQSLESKSSDDHATLTFQITSLTTKLQNSEQLSDESQTELRNSTESSRKLQINLDDALEQVAFHVTELEDLRGVMADKEREKEEEKGRTGGGGFKEELERVKRELEETQSMAEEALVSSEGLTEEVEKLKAKDSETSNLLTSAILHSETLTAELSELKKSGPDKKAEEGLRKELEEANKMLEEAVEHSEELTVEIEGLKSKLKQTSPKKVITRLKKELSTLQKDSSHTESTLTSEINSLKKTAKNAVDEESKLRSEITEIKIKLSTSETSLSSTSKKLTSTQKIAQEAAEKVEGLKGDLERVKGENEQMSPSKDLDDVRSRLNKSSSIIDELEKSKETLTSNLKTTKSTLATTIVDAAEVKKERNDYKSALANMSLESNELQKVEEELRAEIKGLKEEVERLEAIPPPPPPAATNPNHQRLKVLAEKNAELGSTITLQASQIQTLTASLAHLKKTIASASGDSNNNTNSPIPKLPPPPSFSPAITSSPVISSAAHALPLSNTSLKDLVDTALETPTDQTRTTSTLKTLLNKCTSLKTENAHLLSKIQKISNSIQVCCRIRPLRSSELRNNEKVVVEPLSETEAGYYDKKNGEWKSFVYDKVFGPDQEQQDIFEQIEPLCLSVVDGYNACIFAYGQTGSGKTYTMEGMPEDNQWGICVRTLHKIFEILDFRKMSHVAVPPLGDEFEGDELFDEDEEEANTHGPQFNYSIEIGMLEIYNEDVRDLLSPDLVSVDLKRDSAGKIQVPNLTRKGVTSLNDVIDVMGMGKKNRAVAATNMNDQSSRSHMILNAIVSSWIDGQPVSTGQLYLVDLAGSERVNKSGVQNKELKEAQHINLSLSALGDVMEALDKKSSHVPYRNSKLTYCLQDSLGGNSRTMMIVNVCPSSSSGEESLCALQFASRVRRITMSAATRNVGGKNLEEILKKLRFELREAIKTRDNSDSEVKRLGVVAKQQMQKLSMTLNNKSKAEAEESKTTTSKITILQRSVQDMTSRWQKEKHVKEDQVLQIENLQREIRRIQQQMSKAVRDREAMSKKLMEREQQLLAVHRENRQAMIASKNAVGTAAQKQSSHNSRSHSVFERFSNEQETPGATPGSSKKKNGGSRATTPQLPASPLTVEAMKEEIAELLCKHEPTKLDKLQDLFDKFVGKENILLEKMQRRYSRLGGGGGTPGKRQQLAFDKSISRMKG